MAGETVEYYDLQAEAETLGIGERVTFAGYLADEEIDDYLAASDVCLCMRWPTSRETSASWLRCLAAGKPTISTDLVHTVDVPTLDPRNWSVLDARLKSRPTEQKLATKEPPTEREPHADQIGPVGVSIDILDEDHSLKLAIRRLATDEKLRAALGSNARALWAERFRLEGMVAGYQRVDRAAPPGCARSSATASRTLPLHLRVERHRTRRVAGEEKSLGPEYHLRDAD